MSNCWKRTIKTRNATYAYSSGSSITYRCVQIVHIYMKRQNCIWNCRLKIYGHVLFYLNKIPNDGYSFVYNIFICMCTSSRSLIMTSWYSMRTETIYEEEQLCVFILLFICKVRTYLTHEHLLENIEFNFLLYLRTSVYCG